MKGARNEDVHIVWFYLYKNLEDANRVCDKVDQQLPGAWSGGRIYYSEAQGTFRGVLKTPKNVLYRDRCGDHTGILFVSFMIIVYKLFLSIKFF